MPKEIGLVYPTSLTSSTLFTSSTARSIESVGEVWRIDDEWWRTPISRRYVEVILEGGGHVMLYEDLIAHEWFMQTV